MTNTFPAQNKVFSHKPRLMWSKTKTSRQGVIALVGESDHNLKPFMSKTLLTAVQTEFLLFLALPLIPICSYRVTIGEITEGCVFEERSHRYDKVRQPFHWRQIGEIYGFVIVFWSVFLPLGVQFVANFPGWVANLIGTDPAKLSFLALLALLVFLIIWAYALSEMARIVIQKRRYRAVKEQFGRISDEFI